MKFSEWVRWFENKSGEKFKPKHDFMLSFDKDKGFMYWKKDGDIFVVDQTATHNIPFWIEFAFAKAKELRCPKGQTYTRRNAKAFCKLTGGKIIKQGWDNDNRPVAIIEWEERK